jgi:hypothetical protein
VAEAPEAVLGDQVSAFLGDQQFCETAFQSCTLSSRAVARSLCQTVCLMMTWLGQTPFCTAALEDTLIEHDLGIDEIRRLVL